MGIEVPILIVAIVATGCYAAYRHRIEAPLRELEADARLHARNWTGHTHPPLWKCALCTTLKDEYIAAALSTPDAPGATIHRDAA